MLARARLSPSRLAAALEASGARVLRDEPLARHTTLAVGGPVPALVLPADPGQLARVLAALHEHETPYRVLGAGSNVVADDEGLDFAVVATAALALPPRFDGPRVTASAGVSLPRLARLAAERGLAGLEFAIGIPGSVGGALAMNAGAWGGDMAGVVEAVTVVRPGAVAEEPFTPAFAYRTSGLAPGTVVSGASLRLEPGHPPEGLLARLERHLAERRERQPVAARSAGCAFRNPPGDAAGRLVEAAGLKGLARGGAQVSPLHGNFILNRGGARAADVLALIAEVKRRVAEATGVVLAEEVVVWRGAAFRPMYES